MFFAYLKMNLCLLANVKDEKFNLLTVVDVFNYITLLGKEKTVFFFLFEERKICCCYLLNEDNQKKILQKMKKKYLMLRRCYKKYILIQTLARYFFLFITTQTLNEKKLKKITEKNVEKQTENRVKTERKKNNLLHLDPYEHYCKKTDSFCLKRAIFFLSTAQF